MILVKTTVCYNFTINFSNVLHYIRSVGNSLSFLDTYMLNNFLCVESFDVLKDFDLSQMCVHYYNLNYLQNFVEMFFFF